MIWFFGITFIFIWRRNILLVVSSFAKDVKACSGTRLITSAKICEGVDVENVETRFNISTLAFSTVSKFSSPACECSTSIVGFL